MNAIMVISENEHIVLKQSLFDSISIYICNLK